MLKTNAIYSYLKQHFTPNLPNAANSPYEDWIECAQGTCPAGCILNDDAWLPYQTYHFHVNASNKYLEGEGLLPIQKTFAIDNTLTAGNNLATACSVCVIVPQDISPLYLVSYIISLVSLFNSLDGAVQCVEL